MGFWGTLVVAVIFDLGWLGVVFWLMLLELVIRNHTKDWETANIEGFWGFLLAGVVLVGVPGAMTFYFLTPWIH